MIISHSVVQTRILVEVLKTSHKLPKQRFVDNCWHIPTSRWMTNLVSLYVDETGMWIMFQIGIATKVISLDIHKMQSVKGAFLVTSVLIKWVSRTRALSIVIRKCQFKCYSCEMICEEIVSDWEMVRYRVVPPNVGMHEGIVSTKIMIFVTVISVYWSMISDPTW